MLRMIHISDKGPVGRLFPQVFRDALAEVGELTIVEQGNAMSDAEKIELLQKHDVVLTGWGHTPIPAEIAESPGELKYVCNITGTVAGFVPREVVVSDILVSNWGNTPAVEIAEGSLALLLAVLKDMHHQTVEVADGKWGLPESDFGGTLYKATVGVYGCGMIGRQFIEFIQPFKPMVKVLDPYCNELPDGCESVDNLDSLFRGSQIVVVCAGLTEATKHSITSEHLALLPRDGIVINAARGAIIDQDALFAELESGRIRAGLDVLEPDNLPADHPARKWPNLILSGHSIHRQWPLHGEPPTKLVMRYEVCLANLRRFAAGESIEFEITPERYDLST